LRRIYQSIQRGKAMKGYKLTAGERAEIFRDKGLYIAVYFSNAGAQLIASGENLREVRAQFEDWVERYFDTVEDNKHSGVTQ
jgi:hypothetical protein